MRILAFTALLLLSACGPLKPFYRYPCQDPANVNLDKCKRPRCEINGVCPDTLNGLEPKPVEQPSEHTETDT